MFYSKYVEWCERVGKTPTTVAREIGFSKAAVTKWKNGSIPTDMNIRRIAEYFGTSVSEFTDKEIQPEPDFSNMKKWIHAQSERDAERFLQAFDSLEPKQREDILYLIIHYLQKQVEGNGDPDGDD